MSLGDERTMGGGGVAAERETIIDGFEIVDLAARYRIDGSLGQGGMGEVLLATDTRLDRKVAIKRILGEAAGNHTAVRRFLAEAKAIAALNHPNIVQIYEFGRSKEGPFLIIEYVDGGSLLGRCRKSNLQLDEVIDIACQLCDGLAQAHDIGIIHRDIKPANVLLTRNGIPKLTDFGLAKAQADDHGQTAAGAVLGTPDFMPPEQRGAASVVDHRSDLWSLAATIYQMMTGRSPKVIRLQEIPHAFQAVLSKALDEAPEARYQSARELREALKIGFRSSIPTVAVAPVEKGNCPSCGVQNDSNRRFCRGCASPLEAPCLGCADPIPVWEEVCGSCGAKQTLLIEQRRQVIAARQAEADGLLGDLQFDRALAIASSLQQAAHPRLPGIAEWVQAFTAKAEDARDQQTTRAIETLVEAAQHEAAHDYISAIFALEAVPESLRDVRLPNQQESVASVLSRLKHVQSEIRRIYSEIKKRIGAKSLDGLLPEVERLLSLEPQRQDMQKLRVQLIDRRAKQLTARDEAVAEATMLMRDGEYERAVAALDVVAPAVATKEVALLQAQAQEHASRLRTLGAQIQHAITAKQFDGLRDKVEEYLGLKPKDQAALKLRQSLVSWEEKVASEISLRVSQAHDLQQQCRFGEAAALLEGISESRSSEAIRERLFSCRRLEQARSSSLEYLTRATRGTYANAVSQAEIYENLLITTGITDGEFAAALQQGRAHADIDRKLARVLSVYVPTAAALLLITVVLIAGMWLWKGTRVRFLHAHLANQRWDAALALDPRNSAALIGRATQRLAAVPADLDGAQRDLTDAEALSGNTEGLNAAKALLCIALAKSELLSGSLTDASRHRERARQLGGADDALSQLSGLFAEAWLDKAEKAKQTRSSVELLEACAQARQCGAPEERVNGLCAEAKVIDAARKSEVKSYQEALTLLDAAVALNPQRELKAERGAATLGLAEYMIARREPDKAALLLKQAIDLGVSIHDAAPVADEVAKHFVAALTVSATREDVQLAAAAYRVVKSDPATADRLAKLDNRVVGLLDELVSHYKRSKDEQSESRAIIAIDEFDAAGLTGAKSDLVRAALVAAMFDHASALLASGDPHQAATRVSEARRIASTKTISHRQDAHFHEQPVLVGKLLECLAAAGSKRDAQDVLKCIASIGRLPLGDSERIAIRTVTAEISRKVLDELPAAEVAALPVELLELLPAVVVGKLPVESLDLLPDSVLDALDPEIQSKLIPSKPKLLSRLTGDSLGTTEAPTDRRIALSRTHIASHKDGENGAVIVWPLTHECQLEEPRFITSPHRAHDAASFGNSMFFAGDMIGIGSHLTWIAAPHDGRFYLAEINSASMTANFNPAPHTAQYFGHSAEHSTRGFFVVAEDGNMGHGSKAAFTFYRDPTSNGKSDLLMRDIVGEQTGRVSVSWCTVGCEGLVAAAPFRLADEKTWTLQTWRASAGEDGRIRSVARAGSISGFPLMKSDQPRAGSQCKTNGRMVALSQPDSSGGRILLFDCSNDDSLDYLGSIDAPEDAGAEFGFSMTFAGDVLCIGAPNAPTSEGGKGAVYLVDTRRHSGKPRWRRLTVELPNATENFGREIAVADGLMAVSSGKDVVYLFALPKRMTNALSTEAEQTSRPDSLRSGAKLPVRSDPKDSAGTVVNSLGMKFVLIPAGEFQMGTAPTSPIGDPEEEWQHPVRITNPFLIGMHEVTQSQYEQVMGDNPSVFKGNTLPVDHVTWRDAHRFCAALSSLAAEERNGRRYRLPTEAEWEYACRAGTTTVFNTGDTLTRRQARFSSIRQIVPQRTAPVGSFPPNAWGLFDMHGNVWEWTADWFSTDYFRRSPANDPTGPRSGTHHTLRGGSASVQADECYSAIRGEATTSDGPDEEGDSRYEVIGDFGLRIVLTSSD